MSSHGREQVGPSRAREEDSFQGENPPGRDQPGYRYQQDAPSHAYRTEYDLYAESDGDSTFDITGAHSDVMTIEETYLNEDADVELREVERFENESTHQLFVDTDRHVAGEVDVEVQDPVSRWVEKTFSGEAPAVRTHVGGAGDRGSGGVILMGVPPVEGGRSKKFMARKTTKMKKLAQQKKWLCVDGTGSTELVTLTKMDLTQTLGIQLRDLRLLDPMLVTSYPSAILCRERSLVVNLEYIKMIVGLERCYITNLEDDNAQNFVSELKRRLEYQHGVRMAKDAKDARGLMTEDESVRSSNSRRDGALEVARQRSSVIGREGSQGRTTFGSVLEQSESSLKSQQDASAPPAATARAAAQTNQLEDLPFELRVLEVALDIVLKYMETLTSDLEASAHPALDALTTKVETENLERVRRVKNRMVRLTTRVETLREVLEKLLDDDADMRDMNLTAKEAREEQERIHDLLKHGSSIQNPTFDALGAGEMDMKPPETPHSALTYDSDEEEEEAIEVVEQLLEPFFLQADNTWNKLQTLTEYIDDTEDYVNIQLDSQRNQLIRLDLILTCLSASIALITAVTSLFAMNVQLRPGSDDNGPYSWFLIVAITSSAGAIILFLGVMMYSRYKRLI